MICSSGKSIVSNMRQFGCSLIDIEVSTRIDEINPVIHISRCGSARRRLPLGEGSASDDTFEVLDGEAFECRDMRRIGCDGFETDVVKREVVAAILGTGIEVNHANLDVGTRNGRCGDR